MCHSLLDVPVHFLPCYQRRVGDFVRAFNPAVKQQSFVSPTCYVRYYCNFYIIILHAKLDGTAKEQASARKAVPYSSDCLFLVEHNEQTFLRVKLSEHLNSKAWSLSQYWRTNASRTTFPEVTTNYSRNVLRNSYPSPVGTRNGRRTCCKLISTLFPRALIINT